VLAGCRDIESVSISTKIQSATAHTQAQPGNCLKRTGVDGAYDLVETEAEADQQRLGGSGIILWRSAPPAATLWPVRFVEVAHHI